MKHLRYSHILVTFGFIALAAFGLRPSGGSIAAEMTPAATSAAPAGRMWLDFGSGAFTHLPKDLVAVNLTGAQPPGFHLTNAGGRRALVDDPRAGDDVLFYKTPSPLQSVQETYSFLYSGPESIVEPLFVNTKRTVIEGIWTNLSASQAKNNSAGNIAYRYKDGAGTYQNVIKGRLRTEPYFYQKGHVYRVDAIADGTSGIWTTRVYDTALGSQTFDTHVTGAPKTLAVYPGIFVHHGAATILDFGFGPAGDPPRRPHIARSAREYLNYLGYNASVAGPTSSAKSQAFQKFFPALLIKHVRVSAERRFLPSINAVSRYGIDADVLTGRSTTIEGLKNFIAALSLPPDAIELWNEPNSPYQGSAYDPQFATDLPVFATQVAQAFPNTRIWGPSILPAPSGFPQDMTQLAPLLGSHITAWNTHSYTAGSPENLGYGGFISNACGPSLHEDCGWYGSTNYNDNLSAVLNPGLPGMSSEGAASYASYPQICGHSNVDLPTQQAYVERGMLYNFKLGHVRIFPYKFMDEGKCADGGGTMGLLSYLNDSDGQPLITPKPSYVSLVYLDHILADPMSPQGNVPMSTLSYALSGAAPDIEELLLGESDGTYRLVLWSDKSLWDFNVNGPHKPGSEAPLAAQTVEVELEQPMEAAVFTQIAGVGSWRMSGSSHSATIRVSVDQYPLVIALSSKGEPNLKTILPTAVPTAGPTEPPKHL